MENFYQLLGVPDFSDIEDVQRAYSRLYGELFAGENPLGNIPRIKQIKEALDILSDPERRKEYDAQLKLFLLDLERQYEKAVDALSEGEFETTIRLVRECLKINPREPDFYETLGLAYQLSQRLDEASKTYQQGLSLNVKNALFHWYLGDLNRTLLDYDKADSHYLDAAEGFKEILKIDPRNVEALELLADTYSKMKWFEEALGVFEKLVEQFPYKAEYRRDIGAVYYELDLLNEAEEHLQEAMRNAPEDSSAFLYLGLVFFKRRLLTRAVEYLDESLKRQAGQPEVIKLLEKIKDIQKEVGRTVEEIIDEPNPDAVVEGVVKWFNAESGVGVLSCPEYSDVLLHFSAIKPEDLDDVEKGQAVRFGVVKDKVGPIAVQVEFIDSGQDSDTFPGVIERFDEARRIGVIKTPEGKEVLFHFSALSSDLKEHLDLGQAVLFEVKTSKGISDAPIEQALNVRPRKKTKKG